ncbi:unnamed protein product [Lactuca virosa]|uniref:DUF4283 domain-containing protein n=1 Tax=Lactuca virosa TaxID=75947 RepID=A0AAU9PU97_9ASTR|nr:unnamed protein product [Lactuca virosa]
MRRPTVSVPYTFLVDQRDSRSFVNVVGGRKSASQAISLSCIQEIQDWATNFVLVGEAKSFDLLCNFPSLVDLERYGVCDVKYLGGMIVAVKFKIGNVADMFKANKGICQKWFASLDKYGKNYVHFERVAWIKITSIPPHAWDEGNFNSISGNFGKVLVQLCSFWNRNDISFAKLCILMAYRAKINEELLVLIDGTKFKIGVFEVDNDWVLFKLFIVNHHSDSDEEDDDED